ncbi:MAG: SdrD B-like domain-containing protein, partial [Bacteroidota bacterium]
MKTNLLRNFLFSIVLCLMSCASLQAQWVSIPDTAFGNWLNGNGFSTCLQGDSASGWQMDTTCPQVVSRTAIGFYSAGIKDLTGINYFDTLVDLRSFTTPLTNLPSFPKTLRYISIRNSLLSTIPPLPDNMYLVDLPDNALVSLPAIPNGVVFLDCSNNQLTALPALPSGMSTFWASYNQLTSIPELPDSLYWCRIDNNPITCLPQLKRIVYLWYTNTLITCQPNYGNVTSYSPNVPLPICDVFNANGCEVYEDITGKVFLDANGNCVQDSSENGLVNIPVSMMHNGNLLQRRPTLGQGTYSFEVDSFSTYVISMDTSNIPFTVICPSNGAYTLAVTALDSLHYNNDFALDCKPGFDLAAWSIAGRFRPATGSEVDIHVGSLSNFYGVNCLTGTGVSGSVEIVITGPATYVAPATGALTPDNVSGNTLTYNVADFGTIDFNNSFGIMVQTDNTAAIGSIICFTVTVTATNIDAVPTNNTLTQCFTVVGSFDPNDKQVYPLSDVDVN